MCSVFGGARPPSRPPSAGSGQALRGRRDDGGSGREAGGESALACVHSVGPMCPVLGLMCPVFGPMCPVFGGAPSLGMGHGRKARFPIRQAQGRLSASLRCVRNDNGGGGCVRCRRSERRVVRGERRGAGALGMRAGTGWQIALELIVALGPGWGRRDDEGWDRGASRGRGWRVLAMTSLLATQSVLALLAVAARCRWAGTGLGRMPEGAGGSTAPAHYRRSQVPGCPQLGPPGTSRFVERARSR